jgi:hypothetical protein
MVSISEIEKVDEYECPKVTETIDCGSQGGDMAMRWGFQYEENISRIGKAIKREREKGV